MSGLIWLVLGGAAGLLVGLLWGAVRWRSRLLAREAALAAAREELAALAPLREENTQLKLDLERLEAERKAQEEKLAWTEKARAELREAFESLASRVLKENAEEFLKQAHKQLDSLSTLHRKELEGLIKPLDEALKKMEAEVRQLETKREGAYKGLEEQLRQLAQAQETLHTTTVKLERALRESSARGRWGELQLRRVVELAGLQKHVDFEEQVAAGEGRPDMLVYLPRGGVLAVDAKAPMKAYLAAMEATDDAERRELLRSHAQALRQRIQELGQKRYWESLERSPELVVMFVPSEACIAAAFDQDPTILELGLKQGVVVASPTTLLALLKAVAYGWQQHEISENARAITQEALELYSRMVKFLNHFRNVGTRLEQAVAAYNKAVGSASGRLYPAARRLEELAAAEEQLPELPPVDNAVRPLPDPPESEA